MRRFLAIALTICVIASIEISIMKSRLPLALAAFAMQMVWLVMFLTKATEKTKKSGIHKKLETEKIIKKLHQHEIKAGVFTFLYLLLFLPLLFYGRETEKLILLMFLQFLVLMAVIGEQWQTNNCFLDYFFKNAETNEEYETAEKLVNEILGLTQNNKPHNQKTEKKKHE